MEGWSVTFLEEDLKTSLPRRFVFQSDVKILDLAWSLSGQQGIPEDPGVGCQGQ
jgi:hypothetical protein